MPPNSTSDKQSNQNDSTNNNLNNGNNDSSTNDITLIPTPTHGSTNEGEEDENDNNTTITIHDGRIPKDITNDNEDLDSNKPQTYPITPPTTREINENSLLLPRSHPSETNDDDDDNMSKIIKLAKRPSFIWICCLGIIGLIIFQLTFLPRTSLARDYRRWHGIHLTKSDVKRNWLQMTGIGKIPQNQHDDDENLSIEDNINNWLTNFTNINLKSKINLISDDNPKLTHFVESNFKKFGFKTEKFNYEFKISQPEGSNLKLIDSKNEIVYEVSEILEPKFQTPAFYSFGINANVTGHYIYVNHGDIQDYDLLNKNKIDLKNKIFIIKNHNEENITVGEKIALAEYYGAIGILTIYEVNNLNNQYDELNLNNAISRDCNSLKSKIPVIPISKKLLNPIMDTKTVSTTKNFENWEYSPFFNSKFKLQINSQFSNTSTQKLTNIVGSIKGIMNDADIIIGARRDSYTSNNPLSGHAILLEIMRNYQRLVKQGWKPLRNIKFISWDGSYLNLLGVKSFTNDTKVFNPKRSIVSYINIDGDAIMGSKFNVDSNPVFNHILRKTSRLIPIPKKSSSLKAFVDDVEEYESDEINSNLFDDDEEDNNDKYTTLHKYWEKQDNNKINNNLGYSIINSESKIFQQHLSTPIINLKFINDPKKDCAKYIPNSNYYSKNWIIKQNIDDDLLLHGSLIRFIGLLGISLSEHEVVDYKTFEYFKTIEKFYNTLLEVEDSKLHQWNNSIVSNYLIYKYSIFQDLDTNEPVKFHQILNQFSKLINDTVEQSKIFDLWNSKVEIGLIQDYPWYKYYKKLQHFAQFKVSNYKLSHLEKDLKLNDQDYTYLESKEPTIITNNEHKFTKSINGILDGSNLKKYYYNSIIYGNPKFNIKNDQSWYNERTIKSTFTYLYEAIDSNDYELTIKWFVLIYEKLKNVHYKMT
ncbi:uncharacterized protein KGF55_000843 [Candida pseudojiufengensis]|uniref:uncharacterized protein n=1 Tax=Candida pseudojiufengensis TaxID=497109 RepID=UPI0022248E76|nr:uncharacterized protein KGF55_000843 [Candida pseudojiufengensis]KAI5966534.1 hypothetical protein KGF55_000843 [Candida pseudojiufengensis]